MPIARIAPNEVEPGQPFTLNDLYPARQSPARMVHCARRQAHPRVGMTLSYMVYAEALPISRSSNQLFPRSEPVGEAELNGKYRRLRTELDAAYTRPEWDTGRIDRLADEIVEVELALASMRNSTPSPSHQLGD
jgi:hypothetical protein